MCLNCEQRWTNTFHIIHNVYRNGTQSNTFPIQDYLYILQILSLYVIHVSLKIYIHNITISRWKSPHRNRKQFYESIRHKSRCLSHTRAHWFFACISRAQKSILNSLLFLNGVFFFFCDLLCVFFLSSTRTFRRLSSLMVISRSWLKPGHTTPHHSTPNRMLSNQTLNL